MEVVSCGREDCGPEVQRDKTLGVCSYCAVAREAVRAERSRVLSELDCQPYELAGASIMLPVCVQVYRAEDVLRIVRGES